MRTNVYLVTNTKGDTAMPEAMPESQALQDREFCFRVTFTGLALASESFKTDLAVLRDYFDKNTQGDSGVSDERAEGVVPMRVSLGRLMDQSFALDETDRVNLSRTDWCNLIFGFQKVRRNKDEGVTVGFQAWFSTSDRKHKIVVVLPDPAPSEATSESVVLMIQYTGCAAFLLFKTEKSRTESVRIPNTQNVGNGGVASSNNGGVARSDSLRSLSFRFTGHEMTRYLEHLRDAFENRFVKVPGAGPHEVGIRKNVQLLMHLDFIVDEEDPENLEHQSTFHNRNPMHIFYIRRNKGQAEVFASNPFFHAKLRSADNKHTVQVLVPVDRTPGEPVIIMQYTGPLRFKTYKTPKGLCQAVKKQ